MTGNSKNNRKKIIWESAFDNKKKKPGLKFNPGVALTGVRTTGLLPLQKHIQASIYLIYLSCDFSIPAEKKNNNIKTIIIITTTKDVGANPFPAKRVGCD